MFAFVFIMAGLGAIALIGTVLLAGAAPAQAAGAAIAAALAVVPYVLARSLQLPEERKEAQRRHEELLLALKRKESGTP